MCIRDSYVGIELKWEGKDENEKGICVEGPEELIGKTLYIIPVSYTHLLVEVSPDFYRPTDVVNLWGDPTKAKAKLCLLYTSCQASVSLI